MNKKGFTLVELLATLIVLALVMSLGTYSISSIIENSKEKNYELLISNIKDAAESYYNECRYMKSDIDDKSYCYEISENEYQIELKKLVSFGFLKGNDEDDSTSNKVTNPKTGIDVSKCEINIKKEKNEKIIVDYDYDCINREKE